VTSETAFLDSSAIVKLVVDEREATALRAWTDQRGSIAVSAIALTEVLRAVRRADPALAIRARLVLEQFHHLPVDDENLTSAALLGPPALRTLDAIHLAAALTLGDELLAIVTYDDRMAEAARSLGLPVIQPGVDPTIRER
jgi:uncharacterized protein